MQKKLQLQYIAIFLLQALLIATNSSFAAEKTTNWKFEEYKGISVPDDVPIFDASNEKHYFEEYEGKTLLMVFWASWCAPCVAEMVDLDILQKDFRKLPFAVLAISEDYQGVKAIESFYKLNDIRHLAVVYDYRNALFNAFGVAGLPTSFLITEDGMNVATFKGAVNWYDDDVRSIILSHIPGNPPEPKNSYKSKSLNQLAPVKKAEPGAVEVVKELQEEPEAKTKIEPPKEEAGKTEKDKITKEKEITSDAKKQE
jgi:thiol-disulfide isomerase/thioredoxin